MNSSRLPDAKSAKDQALLVKQRHEQERKEDLKRKRLERIELKRLQSIEKSRLLELEHERNEIIRVASIQAANKKYHSQVKNLSPELATSLEDLGFVVVKRKEVGKFLAEDELFKLWEEKYLPEPDLKGFLNPLDNLLVDFLTKKLANKKSKKEISQIVLVVLDEFYSDVNLHNINSLIDKLSYLQEFENSYDPISPMDLIFKFPHGFVKSETGLLLKSAKFDEETERLISNLAFDLCWKLENRNQHWKEMAENLSIQVESDVWAIKANTWLLTWFVKPLLPGVFPSQLSQSFFWLASEDGQSFLEKIYSGIEKAVSNGQFLFEYKISSSDIHIIEALKVLLSGKGYVVEVFDSGKSALNVQINWSK